MLKQVLYDFSIYKKMSNEKSNTVARIKQYSGGHHRSKLFAENHNYRLLSKVYKEESMDFDIFELLEKLKQDESWGESPQDREQWVNMLTGTIINS